MLGFIPAPLFCLTKGSRGAARATGLSMDLRFFCGPIHEHTERRHTAVRIREDRDEGLGEK